MVGTPYSGTPEVIASWARSRGWMLIEPPTPEEILAGGEVWLDQLARRHGAPIAIPRLERCYLRHYDGLGLIRQLLDQVLSRPRRCLIGCSSWAWAYLGRVLKLDALAMPPLTLEAMDERRLQRWFTDLAVRHGGKTILFRQSDSGEFVLPPPQPQDTTEQGKQGRRKKSKSRRSKPECSDFLEDLAAYSRGNPGVAWAIWRYGLRSTPDEGERPAEDQQEGQGAPAGERTLCVRPWSKLKLPALSDLPSRNEFFVLHALLLHDYLSSELITQLLPISSFEILQALRRLQSAELLELNRGGWRVTPLGYPAVRELLYSEGYLVDPL